MTQIIPCPLNTSFQGVTSHLQHSNQNLWKTKPKEMKLEKYSKFIDDL